MGPADIPEYAAALRDRPNDEDMRKHLLYYPISRVLYRLANWTRLRLGIKQDAIALVFPGAIYGATSVVLAYLLFLRFMRGVRPAAAAAACYAFTYSVWIFSSVTESYALTTLSVNIFLFVALAEYARRDWLWFCGLVALASFSILCDLRSLFLLIVPIYLIARARTMKWTDRIGAILFIVVSTLCVVVAAYQLYKYISGYEGFGVYALSKWLLRLGGDYTSFDHVLDLKLTAKVLSTFSFGAISPLYQGHLDGSSMIIKAFHLFFALSFLVIFVVLIFSSLRYIGMCLLSSISLQGLACWLIVDVIYHIFFSPWSALHFSHPLILPLLLLVLPGIVGAWSQRRFGIILLFAFVAVILANNLIVINEARLAWQLPDLIQTPADRVYLLPGEIERMRFLARKGVAILPKEERSRLAELKAKPRSSLAEGDRREIDDLVDKGLGCLIESEREEGRELFHRYRAVIRLARGEKLTGVEK